MKLGIMIGGASAFVVVAVGAVMILSSSKENSHGKVAYTDANGVAEVSAQQEPGSLKRVTSSSPSGSSPSQSKCKGSDCKTAQKIEEPDSDETEPVTRYLNSLANEIRSGNLEPADVLSASLSYIYHEDPIVAMLAVDLVSQYDRDLQYVPDVVSAIAENPSPRLFEKAVASLQTYATAGHHTGIDALMTDRLVSDNAALASIASANMVSFLNERNINDYASAVARMADDNPAKAQAQETINDYRSRVRVSM